MKTEHLLIVGVIISFLLFTRKKKKVVVQEKEEVLDIPNENLVEKKDELQEQADKQSGFEGEIINEPSLTEQVPFVDETLVQPAQVPILEVEEPQFVTEPTLEVKPVTEEEIIEKPIETFTDQKDLKVDPPKIVT